MAASEGKCMHKTWAVEPKGRKRISLVTSLQWTGSIRARKLSFCHRLGWVQLPWWTENTLPGKLAMLSDISLFLGSFWNFMLHMTYPKSYYPCFHLYTTVNWTLVISSYILTKGLLKGNGVQIKFQTISFLMNATTPQAQGSPWAL